MSYADVQARLADAEAIAARPRGSHRTLVELPALRERLRLAIVARDYLNQASRTALMDQHLVEVNQNIEYLRGEILLLEPPPPDVALTHGQ